MRRNTSILIVVALAGSAAGLTGAQGASGVGRGAWGVGRVLPQASSLKPQASSIRVAQDFDLTADPTAAAWRDAPSVEIWKDSRGQLIAGPATLVQSRWSDQNVYFLFSCPFESLNVKANPITSAETPQLWDFDVAEVFIGSDFERIGRYKEFEVSPQGEWVDLDIDRDNPNTQTALQWNSGFAVKARVDAAARIWYGEMRIPFRNIDSRPPQAGREFRLGLYRLAGASPNRKAYAWSPTGEGSFHVPQAFGTLTLRQ